MYKKYSVDGSKVTKLFITLRILNRRFSMIVTSRLAICTQSVAINKYFLETIKIQKILTEISPEFFAVAESNRCADTTRIQGSIHYYSIQKIIDYRADFQYRIS